MTDKKRMINRRKINLIELKFRKMKRETKSKNYNHRSNNLIHN